MKILLRGVGASPGRAKGKVRVVLKAEDAKNMEEGNILVAHYTTPLLTTAMLKARAIITDEGGIMCHAAIVAREMGIPCVTGTHKATQLLKNGQIVIVDGEEGVVYVPG